MRVHHIAIQVRDLELVAAFYERVLGLARVDSPRDGAVWLQAEGTLVMLERVADDIALRGDDTLGLHVLAFEIPPDARAAWEKRFEQHRVEVIRRTPYSLFVRDPEGNRIAVSHFPTKAGPP